METEKQPWISEFYEKERISDDSDDIYKEMKEASDFLCRSFEVHVESLNKEYGQNTISVIAPPPGFMHAVFDTGAKNPGFLVFFGTSKLVMVLCGSEKVITFVGRKINPDPQKPKKNLKLLGVTWEKKKGGGYLFLDSTGVEVEIHELILRVIRWGAT